VVLAIACVALVLTFRSSEHLAAAYGLAVSATMLATTIAFYHVVEHVLKWKRALVLPLVSVFVIVDSTFVLSALPKIADGAWLPLAISAIFVVTSWTWLEGRRCVAKSLFALQMPLEEYLREAQPSTDKPQGTMVFLTGNPNGIPFIGGRHRWIRARADEEEVVLLTLLRASRPYVEENERVQIERVNDRLHVVQASFGYMEGPSMKLIVHACGAKGLNLDTDQTSFFYADPKIIADREAPLPSWQRAYFAVLARNSRPLPDDLGIPAERRVELGIEVSV
jgi:KUP system potassium uptake protein